jgi:hypothetical protein
MYEILTKIISITQYLHNDPHKKKSRNNNQKNKI